MSVVVRLITRQSVLNIDEMKAIPTQWRQKAPCWRDWRHGNRQKTFISLRKRAVRARKKYAISRTSLTGGKKWKKNGKLDEYGNSRTEVDVNTPPRVQMIFSFLKSLGNIILVNTDDYRNKTIAIKTPIIPQCSD